MRAGGGNHQVAIKAREMMCRTTARVGEAEAKQLRKISGGVCRGAGRPRDSMLSECTGVCKQEAILDMGSGLPVA